MHFKSVFHYGNGYFDNNNGQTFSSCNVYDSFFLLQHIRVCVCVRPPFLGGCQSVLFRVQSLEKSRKTNIRKTNARNLNKRETRSISEDPILFHNVSGDKTNKTSK